MSAEFIFSAVGAGWILLAVTLAVSPGRPILSAFRVVATTLICFDFLAMFQGSVVAIFKKSPPGLGVALLVILLPFAFAALRIFCLWRTAGGGEPPSSN